MSGRIREKDQQVADAEADKATAEKRAKVAVWTAVGSALVIALLSFAIAVSSATTRADDVAQRISADVSAAVVQDARQARVLTGRAELARANGRLAARGLPLVPDPGPTASGDQLLVQAARASVLADLPDSVVADLRRQFAGRDVLPSSLGERPPGLADGVVTTLPIAPGGPTLVDVVPAPSVAAPTARNPTVPPARSSAPPAADPAPAAPAERGLLPLLPDLPVRVPLLSE